MRTNYVLIDFENVQREVRQVDHEDLRILVFVGAGQAKLRVDFAASLQRFGERVEYIKASGNGPNALDFHIAYYIGKLSAADPSAHFHIISNDKGFDPLIQHLRSNRISAERVTSLADNHPVRTSKPNPPPVKAAQLPSPAAKIASKPKSPSVKASKSQNPEARGRIIVSRLKNLKAAKPRTVKALRSTIAAFFQKKLSTEDVEAIVQRLASRGHIMITGNNVSYSLRSDG